MKKINSFLFLILLNFHLFAQEEEKLLSFFQHFDYSELERGLDCSWDSKPERELVSDFFEQFLEIYCDREDWSSMVPFVYKYEISLLKKKNGEIAYYKIVRFEAMENGESPECETTSHQTTVEERSTASLEILKNDFRKTYQAPLNFDALFQYDIVYGSHCGFSGTPTVYWKKMTKLVDSKDKETLISWLKSPNAETQLFGIAGILKLKAGGMKFNRYILKMIDAAAEKEGTAIACSGCLYGEESISELVKEMRENSKRKNSFKSKWYL